MAGGPRKPLGVRTYNATNWEDYKVELERFARTLDDPIWEIIIGELPEPAAPANDDDPATREQKAKALREWQKANAQALQYISCTVAETKRPTIRHYRTAHEAWTKLESAAAAQSGSSVIAGIFRLVQIEQTNFNCMEDYVTAVSN